MKSILSLSLIGLVVGLSALPASAREITGPRGGAASGSGIVVPNRQGGYTGTGQGSFAAPNGGTGSGQGQFKTNGAGDATYSGSGSATGAQGQTVNVNTNGNAGYDPTSGYAGQNTTTVNGNTYNGSTQNGTTTVTAPSGETRTFTKGQFRR